jgi:hypothetical protein
MMEYRRLTVAQEGGTLVVSLPETGNSFSVSIDGEAKEVGLFYSGPGGFRFRNLSIE